MDFNLDIPEHETRAASDLGSHGIKLAYIKGDVCTNAICITVDNKVMMSVDLMYGGADGHKMFGIKRDEWMKGGVDMHGLRLFRFRLMSKPNSPNGALPGSVVMNSKIRPNTKYIYTDFENVSNTEY